MGYGRKAALAFVFIWFFIGGIAHFVFTDAEMRIVPPWVPWPREVVLITGLLELLGALGILWKTTRRVTGWALALFTVAVTPANLFMLQQADAFPAIPYWALIARLPLQVALIVLILWCTAPSGNGVRKD